jgi:hypothetical protein
MTIWKQPVGRPTPDNRHRLSKSVRWRPAITVAISPCRFVSERNYHDQRNGLGNLWGCDETSKEKMRPRFYGTCSGSRKSGSALPSGGPTNHPSLVAGV